MSTIINRFSTRNCYASDVASVALLKKQQKTSDDEHNPAYLTSFPPCAKAPKIAVRIWRNENKRIASGVSFTLRRPCSIVIAYDKTTKFHFWHPQPFLFDILILLMIICDSEIPKAFLWKTQANYTIQKVVNPQVGITELYWPLFTDTAQMQIFFTC